MNERVRYRKNRIYNIKIQINFDVFYLFFYFLTDCQRVTKKGKGCPLTAFFVPFGT
jgi:hypothetical protein